MDRKKYKSKFANARNLVSGIINSKTLDNIVKDLHFNLFPLLSVFTVSLWQ